jgi:hypothetical protein
MTASAASNGGSGPVTISYCPIGGHLIGHQQLIGIAHLSRSCLGVIHQEFNTAMSKGISNIFEALLSG